MYIKIISPASSECLTTTICSRQQEPPISKGPPRQLLDHQQSTIVESPALDQHTYQEQAKDTRKIVSYDICDSDEKPEPKNSYFGNKGMGKYIPPFYIFYINANCRLDYIT